MVGGKRIYSSTYLSPNQCGGCYIAILNHYQDYDLAIFLLPPLESGEGWGGVKNLRFLQELLYIENHLELL
jgi:hypothetical protein